MTIADLIAEYKAESYAFRVKILVDRFGFRRIVKAYTRSLCNESRVGKRDDHRCNLRLALFGRKGVSL